MSANVAIVTGAGGALGRATTANLAASGLTVVAVDRTGDALRELPAGSRREVADTTDPAVAVPLVDRLAAEIGPPAILVNTIGAFRAADRILDVELRPHGIRVNAVAPQLLDTTVNRATFPPEAMAHAVAPEAIAGVIAYLVSDASAPVSGAILPAYGA